MDTPRQTDRHALHPCTHSEKKSPLRYGCRGGRVRRHGRRAQNAIRSSGKADHQRHGTAERRSPARRWPSLAAASAGRCRPAFWRRRELG
eukprot:4573524-Prymnesium_polylepis.1